MKHLIVIGVAVLFITGCNDNKKQELMWQSKFDSLNNELKVKENAVVMLQDVNAYLDSIDSYKKWLKVEMETGISSEGLNDRMKNLMQFIKETDGTIKNLEKSQSGYTSMIAKLRKDFDKKNQEVLSLQKQLEVYFEENANLVLLVSQRDQEIEAKNQEIVSKSNEIKNIELKVENLMKQAKNLEAESYYSRAKAMELAAQRTKLAPKKKKETLKQAYELYSKALDMGYADAAKDVQRLNTSIN